MLYHIRRSQVLKCSLENGRHSNGQWDTVQCTMVGNASSFSHFYYPKKRCFEGKPYYSNIILILLIYLYQYYKRRG